MASHYFGKKVPLDGEVWKPVKGYEGRYDVSNLGRVRSRYMGRKKILKASPGHVFNAIRHGYRVNTFIVGWD